MPAPLNNVIIEICHYYSLQIVYRYGYSGILSNGVKMMILKGSLSFINFLVNRVLPIDQCRSFPEPSIPLFHCSNILPAVSAGMSETN